MIRQDSWVTLLVCVPQKMIIRDSWDSPVIVRREILGLVKDEPLRKHLQDVLQ